MVIAEEALALTRVSSKIVKATNKILLADDHTIVSFSKSSKDTEDSYLNASNIMVSIS